MSIEILAKPELASSQFAATKMRWVIKCIERLSRNTMTHYIYTSSTCAVECFAPTYLSHPVVSACDFCKTWRREVAKKKKSPKSKPKTEESAGAARTQQTAKVTP